VGNPIHPLRGVKKEEIETGLEVGGQRLTLSYDSSAQIPRVFSGTAYTPSGAGFQVENALTGHGWKANLLERRISVRTVSSGGGGGSCANPGAVRASRGDGRTVTMARNSAGQYSTEADTTDRLEALPDGRFRYHDTRARALELYDNSGRLIAIDRADGAQARFTYSDAGTASGIAPAPGYLIQVIDERGRRLSFTYTAPSSPAVPLIGAGPLVNHLLHTVSDSGGVQLTLAYDSANRLSSLLWADGRTRSFLYEDSAQPRALTGIIDENQQRFASFGYDSAGRAISTERAGSVERISVSYSSAPFIRVTEQYDSTCNAVFRYSDWVGPEGTVITGPTGASSHWGAQTLLNKTRLTAQSQAAGSGCSASSSHISYDANANVASRDDFNGHRTCYLSDLNRNLETVKVEGLTFGAACAVTEAGATLPAGSRKESTEWHPDWSLKTRVAEPGRITTSVYNGQPDPFGGGSLAICAPSTALLPNGKPIAVLCKQVEQATTDVTGSLGFSAALQPGVVARVRSWTYNELGQVLTEKDPLNNTTHYEYYPDTAFTGTGPNARGHTKGDLKRVLNAASQQTLYTAYDKNGLVLEMRDANDVLTTYTYDARQRLTRTIVGGQVTTNEYWPTGLLKRVTQPDGVSFLEYGYDDAHRLRSVRDNLGNSITYTLDNLGNRTTEEVKDPGNALRRQLTRSVDALGRVQQITGSQ
jgi:YD repeat-containing protein